MGQKGPCSPSAFLLCLSHLGPQQKSEAGAWEQVRLQCKPREIYHPVSPKLTNQESEQRFVLSQKRTICARDVPHSPSSALLPAVTVDRNRRASSSTKSTSRNIPAVGMGWTGHRGDILLQSGTRPAVRRNKGVYVQWNHWDWPLGHVPGSF